MAVDLNLPLVGDPDVNGTLAQFVSTLRIESNTVRDLYTEDDATCMALYFWGSTQGAGDIDAYNRVMNMVQAFVQQATKEPPVRTLKMINKFAAPMQPGGIVTGPDGQQVQGPPQPMTVMRSNGEMVPFNSDLITDYYQGIFDVKNNHARTDRWYKKMVTKIKILGWQESLIQWNDDFKRLERKIIPHLQWYKAPEAEDVEDMSYIGVDLPLPLDEACQESPQLTAELTAAATQGQPIQAASAESYSQRYNGVTWFRPVVTKSVFWLRDQKMRMTDIEAIRKGIVQAKQVPDESGTQDAGAEVDTSDDSSAGGNHTGGGMGGDGSVGDSGNTGPDGESGVPDEPGAEGLPQQPSQPTQPKTREALIHVQSGKEITPKHEKWPLKRVLRRVTIVQNNVVEDIEAPTKDIPVVIGYNVQYEGRPYGQGAPMSVRNQQGQINKTYGIANRHVGWFQGPTTITPRSIKDNLPDGGRDFNLEPNKTYTVDDETFVATGGKICFRVDAPELPKTVLDVQDRLESQFDTASGYSKAQQGEAPTANASGELVQQLQSAGNTITDFILDSMRDMLWHDAMVGFDMIVRNMSPEDLFELNGEFDLQTITEMYTIANNSEFDFEVDLQNSAKKAQAQQEIRGDFQTGIISKETTQDKLGYDSAQEKGRTEQEQQAQAAVAGAQQGGMPGIQGQTRKTG